ncbi:MAG: hypothetical protein KDI48_06865 [Xanthomonadales bacterium]|nr:hypothetical protein [Xanthomonadales bacterium]
MRRFLLISGLAAMLAASPLLANEKGPNRENRVGNGGPSVSGNLGATPTFDRRFGVVFDGSCSAFSQDSSNDGTAFDTYFVYSPSGQNMQAEVILGTLDDSFLFAYCTPFNPASPTTNLYAGDDDGGAGLGSAFVAADGITMVPNQVYTLVVTSFAQGDSGTYTLQLGGDLQFGEPIEAVPVPTSGHRGLVLLGALLLLSGLVLVRRR